MRKYERMIKAILFDVQGVLYVNGQLNPTLAGFIRERYEEYQFALATSSGAWIRERLKKDGLATYFDLIVTADDAGLSKSDPKLYEGIAKRLGVGPAEILFVDDTEQFIVAAREAGLHAVHYTDPESFLAQHEH